MTKFLRLRWLLASLLWLGTFTVAQATHILGGDIAYEPVASTTAGVPRYHITVRLYRDPLKVEQPEIDLVCSRNGCDPVVAGGFTRTIRLSPSPQATTLTCSGASGDGYTYLTYLFETVEDLPPANWTLSVSVENRVADIINMFSSVNTGFYVSSSLNNLLAPANSSPKFLTTVLPYLCNAQVQRFSFSTFDVDGDSLVYNLVTPQQGNLSSGRCGQDVSGATAQPFKLDRATGDLTAPATPFQVGRYAIATRVDEYRRLNGTWQQIGSATRDITYVARNSTTTSPFFTGLTLGNNTTSQPVTQQIRVQPGQAVRLRLNATDPDAGHKLRFASQSAAIILDMFLVPAGPNQVELQWYVPNLPLGRYTATVAVFNNACPVNGSQEITLSFLVTNQTLAARSAAAPQLTAYPMPFREQVQFRAASGAQAVTIIDGLGRVVAQLTSQTDGRVVWQPALTLPAGLYVARGADGRLLARLQRAAD